MAQTDGTAQTYGTVMIGRLAAPFEDMAEAVRRWVDERQVPGFVREDVMLGDDGRTVVMVVHFDSRESYQALSDDPEQALWWESVAAPMIEGDPQWLDGEWRMSLAP